MMIDLLTRHPGVLMFLNCCLLPAVVLAIGILVGRYRPRFRMPFTLEDQETDDIFNREL